MSIRGTIHCTIRSTDQTPAEIEVIKKWNLFGVCHAKIPLLVSHNVLCFRVLVKQNLKQGVRKLRPCRNCLKLKYSGQRIRVWRTNHSCYGAVRSSPCQPRRAFEILISGDLQIWLQCFLIQLSENLSANVELLIHIVCSIVTLSKFNKVRPYVKQGKTTF